ncbi:MAG: Com family DNA-binding transcriptional regulator [Cohnella sp.]|nr:Com family DNA-binding transcriptional regulator [Cohnella sp.]
MTDVRCMKCDKLLAKMAHCEGEIKCPRCGQLNHIEVMDDVTIARKDGVRLPFD